MYVRIYVYARDARTCIHGPADALDPVDEAILVLVDGPARLVPYGGGQVQKRAVLFAYVPREQDPALHESPPDGGKPTMTRQLVDTPILGRECFR